MIESSLSLLHFSPPSHSLPPTPQLTVGKRIECRLLCETELSGKEVAAFSEKITDGYVLHM